MVYNYTIPRRPIGAMYTSPGPCYGLPTLVGQVVNPHDPRSVHNKYPAWSFGKRLKYKDTVTSPGPCYLPNRKCYRDGLDGTPHYSLGDRTQKPKPFEKPGPGAYRPEKNFPSSKHPTAPQHSFGARSRLRATDKTPAPNSYTLPGMIGNTVQSTKRQMPQYSFRPRSKKGSFAEDLSQSPGPGRYDTTDASVYKNKPPQYSLAARVFTPGDTCRKPGPGAYRPEGHMYSTLSQPPSFYMGIRHSPYTTPLITEPSWE